MPVREKRVLRPETSRYTCDCSEVGGPYEWVKQGVEDPECPFCGSKLEKSEIIHKEVTYTLDEEGKIII